MDPEPSCLVPPLTEDRVIGGGWDIRFVRVMRVDQVGQVAMALVDGIGDGAGIEAECWAYWDGRWSEMSSSGCGPLGGSQWVSGRYGPVVYKAGCAAPGATIAVQWKDGLRRATVESHGLWVVVDEMADGADEATPSWLQDL